jgi:hypothetical protein
MKKAYHRYGKMKMVYTIFTLAAFIIFLSFRYPGHSAESHYAPKSYLGEGIDPRKPPIAESVKIQRLAAPTELGNVLLTASFDSKTVKNKIPGRVLTIVLGENRFILNDQGKDGDEKPGDNIFSIIVKDDTEALTEQLTVASNDVADDIKKNAAIVFNGGRSPRILKQGEFTPFNAEVFNTGAPAAISPAIFSVSAPNVAPEKSLIITDLSVVEDPERTFNGCDGSGNPHGAWTFWTLMDEMANTPLTGISTQTFIKEWFRNWLLNQVINNDPLPDRKQILNLVILPWMRNSNPGKVIDESNWDKYDFEPKLSPFRLLAIANRVDLRGSIGYGGANGEGRLVFCIMDRSNGGVPNGGGYGGGGETCEPLPFTVICEYGLPMNKCETLRAYAKDWLNLSSLPFDPSFNDQLQKLTDQFTLRNKAPKKPNGSAINQIRTNEIALARPWELREFTIKGGPNGTFINTPVAREPASIYNRRATATAANMQILADWVNANAATIEAGQQDVPLTITIAAPPGTASFQGAKGHTLTGNHFWDANTVTPNNILSDSARHIFSLNTCTGCHAGEARTAIGNLSGTPYFEPLTSHARFLQITPQRFGVKATLSAWLTGDPANTTAPLPGYFAIADPAGRPAATSYVRLFNDLDRRARDLDDFVNFGCGDGTRTSKDLARVLLVAPLDAVH